MAQADVAQDYGAILLGSLLAFSLSGCVNMQFAMYWRLYSGEPYRVKSLAIATWLLDWCHSVFVAVALWDSIIVPYGDFDMLDHIPWSIGPAVELTAMITFIVQSFFAYRIYRLQDKRLTVVLPIVALASCRLVAASVSMGEMIHLRSYAAFVRPSTSWIFTLGLTLSALVDIMITTFLCYFLRKNRTMILISSFTLDHAACVHSSGEIVHLIDTLTLWTIQNGSITCAAALASLACWIGMPGNRIFLGFHFVIAKLYANSLLATLNAKQKMRNGRQHNLEDIRSLPVVFPEDYRNAPGIARSQQGFLTRFDPRQLRAGDFKHGQSIRVNVERVVDSKCDDVIMLERTGGHTDGDSAV